jgi:DNA mismatch repair protein MLH1
MTIQHCSFLSSSLQIDPRSLDVNVHPTKREVHFLDEDVITEKIADAIQENLAKQSQSRTFEYQVSDLSGMRGLNNVDWIGQTLLTGGILGDEQPTSSRKRSRNDEGEANEDVDDMIPPSSRSPLIVSLRGLC